MIKNQKVKHFMDLEIYQLAEKIAVDIDLLCRSKPQLKYKFKVVDQLVDAVISIGSNIAEGFGRYHFRDIINFYYYARGSICETIRRLRHFWLTKDFTEEEYQRLASQLRDLHVKLNNAINSTRQQLPKTQNYD